MVESPRVSVAVLNFDGRHLLEAALPSVCGQRLDGYEVVVVDNGSHDDSVAWLAEHWPQVKVVAIPDNIGVTAALNECVRATGGEFVALLNNDMELDPDCLRELLTALEAWPGAAVAAAKLVDYHNRNRLDGAGDYYTWAGEANRRGQGEVDRGQYDHAEDVFSACGGAALYRRAALSAVGGFDERFFAIYEDVDWSFRCQLAGFACRYVPSAVAYHMGSATLGQGLSDFTLYHNWRNAIWVVVKNWPAAVLLLHAPRFLFTQAKNLAWAVKHRRAGLWASVWRDALAGFPEMLRKRRAIQRHRAIGWRELQAAIGTHR